MKLRLHIERLTLEGLSITPQQGVLMQAALETELARLLAAEAPAHWDAGGATASVNGSAVHVAPRTKPSGLGNLVADALHAGLTGGHEGEHGPRGQPPSTTVGIDT